MIPLKPSVVCTSVASPASKMVALVPFNKLLHVNFCELMHLNQPEVQRSHELELAGITSTTRAPTPGILSFDIASELCSFTKAQSGGRWYWRVPLAW